MTKLPCSSLALVLLMIPTPAIAQFEIVPFVAAVSPTSGFSANALPGSRDHGFADAKQRTAFAFGAGIRYWTDSRFGFELSMAHGSSDVRISQSARFTPDTSFAASMTMIGLSGLFRFPLSDLPNPIWLEAGAIRMSRSGRAFKGYETPKAVGGSAGMGTSVPLTDRLRADFGFKALFYHFNLRDSLGTLPGKMQVDLLARIGIALSFGRQPE